MTTRPRTASSAGRGRLLVRDQLVENLKRHVELADGAEGTRQAPDLAERFSHFRALEIGRQDRKSFPKAPRGHAGLMHAVAVPVDGPGHVALEGGGAAREQRGSQLMTFCGSW